LAENRIKKRAVRDGCEKGEKKVQGEECDSGHHFSQAKGTNQTSSPSMKPVRRHDIAKRKKSCNEGKGEGRERELIAFIGRAKDGEEYASARSTEASRRRRNRLAEEGSKWERALKRKKWQKRGEMGTQIAALLRTTKALRSRPTGKKKTFSEG